MLKLPTLWPPDAKNWFIGKDTDAGKGWRWEEKGTMEDEMVGWHHRLDGHEFEQAPEVGVWTGKPGVLQFMGSQSWTWLSNWTELKKVKRHLCGLLSQSPYPKSNHEKNIRQTEGYPTKYLTSSLQKYQGHEKQGKTGKILKKKKKSVVNNIRPVWLYFWQITMVI